MDHIIGDAVTFAESSVQKFPDLPHFALGYVCLGVPVQEIVE